MKTFLKSMGYDGKILDTKKLSNLRILYENERKKLKKIEQALSSYDMLGLPMHDLRKMLDIFEVHGERTNERMYLSMRLRVVVDQDPIPTLNVELVSSYVRIIYWRYDDISKSYIVERQTTEITSYSKSAIFRV
ncbi:hypothetical protein L1987_46882 [Smallanthus sonchifolius]|uniref:Uncharacterized protein n=1 Tax=Smallanthus sonchifolius TaxID=185202 RepID=A0ACB9G1L9_9ASTR|nr:hypothetical protein L1987_46882 [Smallanthus sonchifolius]